MTIPGAPRPIAIAKPPRSGGVLPAPTAIAEKSRSANAVNSVSKASQPRLKAVVRRLAPGLTEEEFWGIIGEDWRLGKGKVDWVSYKPGKVSKDPSKPSRPSRCYFHLTQERHLNQLSEKVRESSFTDVKGSYNDSVLLGPPNVEFAPCGRLPTAKPRKDGRQGTIDQDPEFIDFLESLTNPLPKPPNIDSVSDKENKPGDTKIVTPLVQFLKDKKANKSKETPGKVLKHGRQESKESKGPQEDKKAASKQVKDKSTVPEKKGASTKSQKHVRESAKIEKQGLPPIKVAAAAAAAAKNTVEAATVQPPAPTAPKSERRRERGNASAAAKILQRDLGLAGNQGRRKRDITTATTTTTAAPAQPSTPVVTNTTSAANNPPAAPSSSAPAPAPAAAPAAPVVAKAPPQAPTGPAATRNQRTQAQSQNKAAPPAQPAVVESKASVAAPTTLTVTQAFLKHANPSQGVTEPLLEEAFKIFGSVSKVEIDKKKGFAYIDFADPAGLQKAIAASPVKVAQGQVVVLERKTGPSLQNRNARGGGGAANTRGGSAPQAGRGGRGGGRGRGGRQNTPKPAANATPTSGGTDGSVKENQSPSTTAPT